MAGIIVRAVVTLIGTVAGSLGYEAAVDEQAQKGLEQLLSGVGAGIATFALSLAFRKKQGVTRKTTGMIVFLLLAGCGANLPVEQLQAAQKHAVEACKVIAQLPPLPDAVPGVYEQKGEPAGDSTAPDGGAPGDTPAVPGGEPGAPAEPAPAQADHPVSSRRVGPLREQLGGAIRGDYAAGRGVPRWQCPRRGCPAV